LLAQARAIPRLEVHRDAARHEIRAAGHPVGCGVVALRDPHVLVDDVLRLGLDVGRAVLEPEQVARRRLRRRRRAGATEAELRPAQRGEAEGDAGEVADGVDGDLRVVGAGLDAEVTAASMRVELVGREVRQLAQFLRLLLRQAETILAVARAEQGGAEAERDRQAGRAEPVGLTRVGRGGVVGRHLVRRRQPAHHAFGGGTPGT